MILKQRTDHLLDQFAEREERATQIVQAKQEAERMRQNEEKIKREDKLENAKRTAKMQEFEKERMMAKIQMEAERLEKFRYFENYNNNQFFSK